MIYSQQDQRWANLGIGNIMREKGCLVTAIANLTGKPPDKILLALNSKDCFNSIGELVWGQAIKALGLKEYKWLKGNTKITKPIICETDNFQFEGYPQHFFLALPNGKIWDSLDGQEKVNRYNIVSQRYLG
jgi:hypothetical protein